MSSLRRTILLLACAAMSVSHPRCRCEAFSGQHRPTPPPPPSSSSSHRHRRRHPRRSGTTENVALAAALSGGRATDRLPADDDDDVNDRARPNIVRIATHEDYLGFLQQDDRVCVIKYYADWCKSCQKFGAKYRHLARDLGDRVNVDGAVLRSGNVRFGEVEYTASARLCKTLKVNKLPTVHIHRAGSGKVVDMTCKPSLFHLVVDELHRVLDGSSPGVVDADDAEADAKDKAVVTSDGNMTNASFDMTMVAGLSLGEEIVASLKKKKEEEDEGAKKETNWFWKQ